MSEYRDLLIAIAKVNGHPEPSQYADAVEDVLTNRVPDVEPSGAPELPVEETPATE